MFAGLRAFGAPSRIRANLESHLLDMTGVSHGEGQRMRSDAELYAAAMAGGSEAFAPIVERYADAVFGVALSRLRDFHDAQDVAQQAFVEAFERLGGLRDPARLGAWLRSIAIHRSIDHIRGRRRTVAVEGDVQPSKEPTPESRAERSELRERVLAAIGNLSTTLRETTTLFYINGYSVDQVAAMQDVPVGTVKRRLHDARTRLQEEMIEMVEDTLKSESPRENVAAEVYEILKRYDRPPVPEEKWAEISRRLREIGTDGIEGFIRAFESPHSPTRRFAVEMLSSGVGGEEAAEQLLIQATRDSNKKVRRAAFRALLGIAMHNEARREDVVPRVLPALRDRCRRTRGLFAWYLSHCPGIPEHVPLEEAVRAVAQETENDRRLVACQRELLDAALCVREGRENPHPKHY